MAKAKAKKPVKVVAVEENIEDDLPKIESFDDVKQLVNEGIDKIRASSMEEVKASALKVGNRFYSAFRKLVDGD